MSDLNNKALAFLQQITSDDTQPPKLEIGGLDVSSKSKLLQSGARALLQRAAPAKPKVLGTPPEVPTPAVASPLQSSTLGVTPEIAVLDDLQALAPKEAQTRIPSFNSFKAPKVPGALKAPSTPEAPSLKTIDPPKIPLPSEPKPPKAPDGNFAGKLAWSIEDVIDFFLENTPEAKLASSRKEQDIALWREWNKNPGPHTLKPLMNALKPVMMSEVRRWQGNIPTAKLEIEAQRLTLQAIKTYNPNSGTALNTHVTNRLKKLSRPVYKNQDLARLPENNKLLTQTLYKGKTRLSEELGREPSIHELQEELGWSAKKINKVQRLVVDEFVESQDLGTDTFGDDEIGTIDDPIIDYVYYDLSPTDKAVFEMTTGYNRSSRLSNAQITKQLNITPSQLAYRRKQIVEKIKNAQR